MTVADLKTVDAIGEDSVTGKVILNIFDHLSWQNEQDHLQILQEKINSYFEFIETGQLFEEYPIATNRSLEILILGKYPLTPRARAFIVQANGVAVQLGVEVRHTVPAQSG